MRLWKTQILQLPIVRILLHQDRFSVDRQPGLPPSCEDYSSPAFVVSLQARVQAEDLHV